MLQFKEGRFHYSGVSFYIPDGFFLDTGYDFHFEGLPVISPDGKVFVEIGFDKSRKDPKSDLEHYFDPGSDSDLEVRSSLEPIDVNGLQGFRASYVSLENAFVEYRLCLPQGGLMWLTIKQKGVTVRELLRSEHLTAVLDGVH